MPTKRLLILIASMALLWGDTIMAQENILKIRGTLPWHNFLSGPSAWDEEDYEKYLNEMQRLDLNFIGFHCYTGGAERYAPYVEPMIRIEYRDVLPLAGFDTGITARWGYRPLLLEEYAFGTGKLFTDNMEYFGARCAVKAQSNQERYQMAQALMRKVMEMAHQRDIKFAMGFEFGVYPPEFASITPRGYDIAEAMLPDPTHPSSIEILTITIDNLLETYPGIDYVWLWLHEHTGFIKRAKISGEFKTCYEKNAPYFRDAQDEETVFTGVWSLEYITQAYEYISRKAPDVSIIIGGWGGGNQLPAVLKGLDQALPKNIIFSCLNPNQGWNRQIDILTEITENREVWAIPWLEGDEKLWHLQPRVSLMQDHVTLAHEQKLDGVVAIHWRTKETRLNLEAFAEYARQPDQAPSVNAIYQKDCQQYYGGDAANELVPILVKMDNEQWLNEPTSPEYFPYTPQWGRISPELETRLRDLAQKIQTHIKRTGNARHKENLHWLLSNIEFTLLLDKVSRGMEPAYRLQERWYKGEIEKDVLDAKIKETLNNLNETPIEDLFNTFKNRKLNKGELGILSSVNQKLWLQFKELNAFLENLE